MRRTVRIAIASLVASVVVLAATACSKSAPSSPNASDGLVDIGAGLRGEAGLSASVYASGLEHVSALAVDANGNVWAATAAFNDTGTDALYLLPGPGQTPLRVATDVHTPLGMVWVDDTLYVAGTEIVEAFSAFNGVTFGIRETVLDLPAGVGEVNGLALGPDGRFYLGISAPCDHCEPESELSGAVISFNKDGSDVIVEATGIRAPIGLAFYPGSDDLFVTMNQRDDLDTATPGDWLAVVSPGDDWGFPGCYGQGGDACTGVPSPVAELDAHAAVSGLAFVSSDGTTSAIVAEWSYGKLMRVAVNAAGDAYSGDANVFVIGLEAPVPVVASANGTLYTGDWGSGKLYAITGA